MCTAPQLCELGLVGDAMCLGIRPFQSKCGDFLLCSAPHLVEQRLLSNALRLGIGPDVLYITRGRCKLKRKGE